MKTLDKHEVRSHNEVR